MLGAGVPSEHDAVRPERSQVASGSGPIQPDLFSPPLSPLTPVHPEHDESLAERFARFHAENPQVHAAIGAVVSDLRAHGVRRFGMKAIFERLRWLYTIQTRGDDFKLNNNYTAFYARLLVAERPELSAFFEIRERMRCGEEGVSTVVVCLALTAVLLAALAEWGIWHAMGAV
jgi:hypothetical protein